MGALFQQICFWRQHKVRSSVCLFFRQRLFNMDIASFSKGHFTVTSYASDLQSSIAKNQQSTRRINNLYGTKFFKLRQFSSLKDWKNKSYGEEKYFQNFIKKIYASILARTIENIWEMDVLYFSRIWWNSFEYKLSSSKTQNKDKTS